MVGETGAEAHVLDRHVAHKVPLTVELAVELRVDRAEQFVPGPAAGQPRRAVGAEVAVAGHRRDRPAVAGRGVGDARRVAHDFERRRPLGLADALGVADLALEAQVVVDRPLAVEVDVVARGLRARADDVVDHQPFRALRELGRYGPLRPHGRGQGVVGHRVPGRGVVVQLVNTPVHVVVVYVAGRQARVETGQVQLDLVVRLPFGGAKAAGPRLLLLEQGRADQGRRLYSDQLRMARRDRHGRGYARVAQGLLAEALDAAQLVEALDDDAEGVVRSLPADQAVELGPGRPGVGVVLGLERGLERPRLGQGQRLAGPDVDSAGHPALQNRGILGLVDFNALRDLGRQQFETDAAADRLELIEDEPIARRHRVAVHHDIGQAGRGAPDADPVVLVEAAFAAGLGLGVDARQALQGVGDVLVRQLADVDGGDRVDLVGRVLLDLDRLLQRLADAGDDDLAHRVVVGGVGGHRRRGRDQQSDAARRTDQEFPA